MTLDLSAVTDSLIGLVKSQWTTAPIWTELGGGPTFTPNFTGLAPDAARHQRGRAGTVPAARARPVLPAVRVLRNELRAGAGGDERGPAHLSRQPDRAQRPRGAGAL